MLHICLYFVCYVSFCFQTDCKSTKLSANISKKLGISFQKEKTCLSVCLLIEHREEWDGNVFCTKSHQNVWHFLIFVLSL